MNLRPLGPDHPVLNVRTENPDDAPWLLDLYASTRKEELDAAGFPEALRPAFLEQQFRARHATYSTAFATADWWILCVDQTPVGRVILHRTASEYRIVDLALLPVHRGRGIGTRILEAVQWEAAAAGVPVRLQAFPGSDALRLYLRLGFRVTGEAGLRVQLEWPPGPCPPSRNGQET